MAAPCGRKQSLDDRPAHGHRSHRFWRTLNGKPTAETDPPGRGSSLLPILALSLRACGVKTSARIRASGGFEFGFVSFRDCHAAASRCRRCRAPTPSPGGSHAPARGPADPRPVRSWRHRKTSRRFGLFRAADLSVNGRCRSIDCCTRVSEHTTSCSANMDGDCRLLHRTSAWNTHLYLRTRSPALDAAGKRFSRSEWVKANVDSGRSQVMRYHESSLAPD